MSPNEPREATRGVGKERQSRTAKKGECNIEDYERKLTLELQEGVRNLG